MASESVSYIQRISWILNVLFHQALAIVISYILYTVFLSGDVNSKSTWHKALTPLGFLLLMMESLIVFRNDNIHTLHLDRIKKQYIHSALQFTSTLLITIGIAFMISEKNSGHFTSTHAILGLTAWIFVWCSVIFGVATSQSQLLKNLLRPVWLKLIHIVIGICAFTFGTITLCYGLREYFNWFGEKDVIIAAIVTISILYLWVLIDPLKSLYNQIRTIFNK